MAERAPSLWVPFLLVVVILVVSGVGGGWLYFHNHPTLAGGPRVVGLGDNVTVDYIGVLGSGPEQGRVFDTSIQSVANNNLTWPKSLEYGYRNSTSFVPLGVHVGSGSQSGYTINNTTFGSVVPGFWEGLLWLAGNQTRWISIPPSLAYGSLDPSCLVKVPLVTTVPQLLSLPLQNFSANYSGISKVPGAMFSDPTYGWTDMVFSVNGSSVTVERLPTLGFSSTTPGWPITVTALTNGNLTITSDITSANVGLLLGHTLKPVCSSSRFIISAVDPTNGTFTENFNTEVTGQTLVFRVTVVDIYA